MFFLNILVPTVMFVSMISFPAKSADNYFKDSSGKIRMNFDFKQAVQECRSLGGRLPTLEEALKFTEMDNTVFTLSSKASAINIINYALINISSNGLEMFFSEEIEKLTNAILSHIKSNPRLFQRHFNHFSEPRFATYITSSIHKVEAKTLENNKDITEKDIHRIIDTIVRYAIFSIDRVPVFSLYEAAQPESFIVRDVYFASDDKYTSDGRLPPCNLKVWTDAAMFLENNEGDDTDDVVAPVFVCKDGKTTLIYDSQIEYKHPDSRAALFCVRK